MAIFGQSFTHEEQMDFTVAPTIEGGYEIAFEAYENIHKLTAGLYIADILIEEKVTEGFDGEILAEATFKEYIDKAVKVFVEFKEKIVKWFEGIKKTLFVQFGNIAKVVEKYENEIKENAKVNPITVKGYNYIDDPVAVCQKYFDNYVAMVKGLKADEDADAIKAVIENIKKSKTSEEITAEIRNGKEPIEGIKVDVNKMIAFVKNFKDHTAKINKMYEANKKEIDGIISTLKAQKKEAEKDAAKKIQTYIRACNLASNASHRVMVLSVKLAKEMYQSYSVALKKQLKAKPAKEKKPAKESFEASDSVLESALELL